MLSAPPPREAPEAADLRGRIFTDLDRLAFALEMEVAECTARGDHAAADRAQSQRLGVRLAQRLVTGVWADEVNQRLERWEEEYQRRLGQAAGTSALPSRGAPVDEELVIEEEVSAA